MMYKWTSASIDTPNMKTYIQQRRQNMSDGQQRQENKTLTIQSKQEPEKAQTQQVNAKETHTNT